MTEYVIIIKHILRTSRFCSWVCWLKEKIHGIGQHYTITSVQAIRRKLKAQGITASWTTLRKTLSVQQRITASFKQRDDRTLNIRKGTVVETGLQDIYEKLGVSATPGGIQKLTM